MTDPTSTALTAAERQRESKGNADDKEYEAYRLKMQARFRENAKDTPLFLTELFPDVDLFSLWLGGFPPEARQFHNCAACRQFVNHYGGLVTIDERGHTTSAFWNADDAPAPYRHAVRSVRALVEQRAVTGVFLSSKAELGQWNTGVWHHMALPVPESAKHRGVVRTAGQAMAEKREELKMVQRALRDFPQDLVQQAVNLLRTETLYRSEKVIGPAEWLLDLHKTLNGTRGRARDNMLWRAVASAPAGFCHPRSSMVGTLLDDLAQGLSFETARARFAEKMHPAQYQRPQAPPTRGNIEQAERLIDKLNLSAALKRRYAHVEELEALWRSLPERPEQQRTGVFGHVKAKDELPAMAPTTARAGNITFAKFQRDVLPRAEKIKLRVPPAGNFGAITTAADPDAPPILRWDHPEKRNPFSWYIYVRASPAVMWNLPMSVWRELSAIVLQPNLWHDPMKMAYQGAGALLVLPEARDSQEADLALFPEILLPELREVRATIEAFSRAGRLEGRKDATACGLFLQVREGKLSESADVRVLSGGQWTEYTIDRWE